MDMYVRDARKREEVWLLDHIESMGLDDAAFRSRDYVVAIDEESGAKAGFGRIRIHTIDDGDVVELTSLGVLDGWRNQGVGAHVIERLLDHTGDRGFEEAFALVTAPDYVAQFGFEPIDEADLPPRLRERLATKRERFDDPVVPMRIAIDEFAVPDRLREAFKRASKRKPRDDEGDEVTEVAEEFGIDPETATYKYDTSGSRR